MGEHFASIAATAARSALSEVPGFTNADEARAAIKARLLTDAYQQDTGAEALELRVTENLLALTLRQAREEPGLQLERHELHGAPLHVLTSRARTSCPHRASRACSSGSRSRDPSTVGFDDRHARRRDSASNE